MGRGEAPSSALAPPPKYPPRTGRPVPLVDNSEQDYLLAVSKEFRLQMRTSPFYLRSTGPGNSSGIGSGANGKKGMIERYSDRYEDADEKKLELDWDRFPRELRPEFRKKALAKKRKANSGARPKLVGKKGQEELSKALEELERKEKENGEAEDGSGSKKKRSGGGEGGSDEEEKDEGAAATQRESDVEGEEEMDEEMDEGTDYANNYFDNGEGYLDGSDDNLDEGGIY